jgi:uncharacterized OB-fold protein
VSYRKPLPEPTPDTLPFWEGCKRHELRLQRCGDCAEFYFYPRAYCPRCLGDNIEWRTVSGEATLLTYVINHRAAPGFDDEVPYVTAIVRLAEGPHLMTNIVGIPPDPGQLPPGLPVTVVFDDVTDTITLPKFRPAQFQPREM